MADGPRITDHESPNTEKVLLPKCPHCGEDVSGLNVSSIILPTPKNPAGDMTFLVPTCPRCNTMITAQYVGYTPRDAGVATPPSNLWKPH
jgi:hypothetical protein